MHRNKANWNTHKIHTHRILLLLAITLVEERGKAVYTVELYFLKCFYPSWVLHVKYQTGLIPIVIVLPSNYVLSFGSQNQLKTSR